MYFFDVAVRFVPRSHCDFFRELLGYRLELRSARLPGSVRPGGKLEAELRLVNRGFSAPVNARPVLLVLKCCACCHSFRFHPDIRRGYVNSTEQVLNLSATLTPDTLPGVYQAGFALPDASETLADNPDFAIRCANFLTFRDGVNWLDMEITVHADAEALRGE